MIHDSVVDRTFYSFFFILHIFLECLGAAYYLKQQKKTKQRKKPLDGSILLIGTFGFNGPERNIFKKRFANIFNFLKQPNKQKKAFTGLEEFSARN